MRPQPAPAPSACPFCAHKPHTPAPRPPRHSKRLRPSRRPRWPQWAPAARRATSFKWALPRPWPRPRRGPCLCRAPRRQAATRPLGVRPPHPRGPWGTHRRRAHRGDAPRDAAGGGPLGERRRQPITGPWAGALVPPAVRPPPPPPPSRPRTAFAQLLMAPRLGAWITPHPPASAGHPTHAGAPAQRMHDPRTVHHRDSLAPLAPRWTPLH